MPFTDEQYFLSIANNETVKESFNQIKRACQELQVNTDCPDEDIDDFLKFIVGKWKYTSLE